MKSRITAAIVEHAVATIVAPMTAVGSVEPISALREIIVVGTKVRLDAVIMMKVHMASVGSAGVRLSDASCCMAARPRGVAAMPRPRRFAAMLAAMSGSDLDFGPSSGKSGPISGRIAEASASVSPDCCAIWEMPDQRPIEPASARQSCTASFAEEMAVVATHAGPRTTADQIVPVASMATQIMPIMPFPPHAGPAD